MRRAPELRVEHRAPSICSVRHVPGATRALRAAGRLIGSTRGQRRLVFTMLRARRDGGGLDPQAAAIGTEKGVPGSASVRCRGRAPAVRPRTVKRKTRRPAQPGAGLAGGDRADTSVSESPQENGGNRRRY